MRRDNQFLSAFWGGLKRGCWGFGPMARAMGQKMAPAEAGETGLAGAAQAWLARCR